MTPQIVGSFLADECREVRLASHLIHFSPLCSIDHAPKAKISQQPSAIIWGDQLDHPQRSITIQVPTPIQKIIHSQV